MKHHIPYQYFGTILIFFLCLSNRHAYAQESERSLQEYLNQGHLLFNEKKLDESRTAFVSAYTLDPTCAKAFFNVGMIDLLIDNKLSAIVSFEQVIALEPDNIRALTLLGCALRDQKEYRRAIEIFEQVISLQPDHFNTHVHLARLYIQVGDIKHAIKAYGQALHKNPAHTGVILEYVYLLRHCGLLSQAQDILQHAIELEPERFDILLMYADLLQLQDKIKEAIPLYQHILSQQPDNKHAHRGLSCAYLARGEFEKGWRESSYAGTDNKAIHDRLDGKTILLRANKDLSDLIQFIRYAYALKDCGATIVMQAPDKALDLLAPCPAIDYLIGQTNFELPWASGFDESIDLSELPRYLDAPAKAVSMTVPYIVIPEATQQWWKIATGHHTQLKIGICWCDYLTAQPMDHSCIIPFHAMQDFLQNTHVRFYCLQPLTAQERTQCNAAHINLNDHLYAHAHTMIDLAAYINSVDLVVCPDGPIAHLAGALGKKTLLLLPTHAHWRWQQYRTDSPWYPTIKIFRQVRQGSWKEVIDLVTHEINAYISHQKQEPVLAEVSLGELIDKITILEIKAARIKDPEKLKHVHNELAALQEAARVHIVPSAQLEELHKQLRDTNEQLWNIEDNIRACEEQKNFSSEFVELARSVYVTNDRRCQIKRIINDILGSRLVEVKQLTKYTTPTT